MRTYGIIGKPLSHSWSKSYFEKKFGDEHLENCRYENYLLHDISELPGLIKHEATLFGLHVTIPYKEEVRRYIDRLDPVAAQIGAVNVLNINRQGEEVLVEGYNTDMPAFRDTFKPLLKRHHQRALVLGSGGASRAVVYTLRELGMDFTVVSRYPGQYETISYYEVDQEVIKNHQVIVNATPVGMFPDKHGLPQIPYDSLSSNHLLYDLIYNPFETEFLRKGASAGSIVKNGQQMFHRQAELSWAIWTKKSET